MKAWGQLTQIGVGLVLALTGCIYDEPAPPPRVPQSPGNGLTNEQVHWYLKEGFHEFWSCWSKAPTAESKVAILEISISKEGTVATTNFAGTTFDNPNVFPCIEDHIRRIRFPPRDAPTTARIRLVFPSTTPQID